MARRSRGEGSLHQRKDGRWQAALQVDGVRRTVYGRTRQEAARKLADLQRQAMAAGALPQPGTKTLADLVGHWLETAAPNLKPRTLADYRQTFRLYIAPTLGQVRLDRLTPDRLQRLYSDLQARGRQRAAHKAHAVLHRALKLAVLWRWLSDNPAERVLPPTYQAARKDMWTPWELNVFLAGAREHRLYPAWVLALASGCRLGELLALTWADVDPDAGTLRVARNLQRIGGEWVITEPKTSAGVRAIALPGEGVAALRLQRERQAAWRIEAGNAWQDLGLVFTRANGEPLHQASVSHGLRSECKRLGIPALSPHGLRHLHASLLLGQGLPVPAVSRRLGHAHAGITMTVYAHALGSGDQDAARAIGQALGSGGQRLRSA